MPMTVREADKDHFIVGDIMLKKEDVQEAVKKGLGTTLQDIEKREKDVRDQECKIKDLEKTVEILRCQIGSLTEELRVTRERESRMYHDIAAVIGYENE